MTRNFKRTAAVIGLVAAGSAALVACSESESGTSGAGSATGGATVEGLSGASGQLVAEGASSQQNAMDYFNVKYQQATNNAAALSYTPSGSGSGRTNFIGNQVKFAGSDSPLSAEQVAPAAERCGGNDAWHLPFVIGPVAIAYNLPGVDSVNLSIPTVAKIFKGEVTTWNDPAIAAENEGTDLPDTAISVVYRSDESGTSDNFQKFLKAAAPEEWDTTGQQFPAAVGEGANGSNGVTTQVGQIDGGITYVESGFATQQELGIANLDFGSGPVELSTDSVGIALDNLEFKSTGHDMVVDTEALFGSTDAGSYPLILTTYEIVCSAGYDENTSNQVKDFLTVALANQDEGLADLGYIPVTGTHHERLAEAVEAIQ